MNGYNCKVCKSYNDVLSRSCRNCYADRPEWITNEYHWLVEIRRGLFIWTFGVSNTMTEQEQLFAKFYNGEKILIKDMDFAQLRQHRSDLSQIAFEAKARLVAADDELRERKSKSGNKEMLLSDSHSQTTSDAINAVAARRGRMTKMDKLRKQLESIGMDENIIKEMIGNLEKKATEDNLKVVTFKKSSVEDEHVVVKTKKEEEESEPFDPSTLFGK